MLKCLQTSVKERHLLGSWNKSPAAKGDYYIQILLYKLRISDDLSLKYSYFVSFLPPCFSFNWPLCFCCMPGTRLGTDATKGYRMKHNSREAQRKGNSLQKQNLFQHNEVYIIWKKKSMTKEKHEISIKNCFLKSDISPNVLTDDFFPHFISCKEYPTILWRIL